MKYLLLAVASVFTFLSPLSVAENSNILQVKPKIVGGEIADSLEYPWMSALVYTYDDVATSLVVDNVNYDTASFNFSPSGDVSGPIMDCGIGDAQCGDATDKICLIKRGDINFSVKADNCEAGGGVGVIIFNHEDGDISGTLGEDFTGTIPVIAITKIDGEILKDKVGSIASISIATQEKLTQFSTCGASFIGDRWLVTASHCVDDVNPSVLKVNVGEYDLSNGAEDAKAVKRIYMHPDFELEITLDNDIALIELVDSVDNPSINILDLPSTEQFAIDNSPVTVIGWGGRVGYDAGAGPTSDFPDVLHQVDLQLLTNEQCKETLANSLSDPDLEPILPSQIGITNAMICAAQVGGGKGSCQGDSGGPLIVNTNEGWQQIGVVSWGIGCAADGYPGVYTRAAVFNDWINEITHGIAIDQSYNFGITLQGTSQTHQLEIFNNSELTANLTFSVDGDDKFSLNADNCTNLAAGASCQLIINYSTEVAGNHTANIIIETNDINIPASKSRIKGQVLALSNDIATQLSSTESDTAWYTGGDLPWTLQNGTNSIESGAITDNQETVVVFTLTGEGEVSFDWSVSSEENVDDPDEPFDALYVYLDGEQVSFISGNVDFTNHKVEFTQGDHEIMWVYRKDPAVSELDDKAYIQNVVFTSSAVVVTPPPVIKPTKSSGGSIAWFSLVFITVLFRFKK